MFVYVWCLLASTNSMNRLAHPVSIRASRTPKSIRNHVVYHYHMEPMVTFPHFMPTIIEETLDLEGKDLLKRNR
jgi:hypothetical protein